MNFSYRNLSAAASFIALALLAFVQVPVTFELTRLGALPPAVLLAEGLAAAVLLGAGILSWLGRRPSILLIPAAVLTAFSAWWAVSKIIPIAVMLMCLAAIVVTVMSRPPPTDKANAAIFD